MCVYVSGEGGGGSNHLNVAPVERVLISESVWIESIIYNKITGKVKGLKYMSGNGIMPV